MYLRALGFAVEALPISVLGCDAYCIKASPPSEGDPQGSVVEKATIELWQAMSEEFLANYKDFSNVRTLKDQQRLLNWTFGIARTQACLSALE